MSDFTPLMKWLGDKALLPDGIENLSGTAKGDATYSGGMFGVSFEYSGSFAGFGAQADVIKAKVTAEALAGSYKGAIRELTALSVEYGEFAVSGFAVSDSFVTYRAAKSAQIGFKGVLSAQEVRHGTDISASELSARGECSLILAEEGLAFADDNRMEFEAKSFSMPDIALGSISASVATEDTATGRLMLNTAVAEASAYGSDFEGLGAKGTLHLGARSVFSGVVSFDAVHINPGGERVELPAGSLTGEFSMDQESGEVSADTVLKSSFANGDITLAVGSERTEVVAKLSLTEINNALSIFEPVRSAVPGDYDGRGTFEARVVIGGDIVAEGSLEVELEGAVIEELSYEAMGVVLSSSFTVRVHEDVTDVSSSGSLLPGEFMAGMYYLAIEDEFTFSGEGTLLADGTVSVKGLECGFSPIFDSLDFDSLRLAADGSLTARGSLAKLDAGLLSKYLITEQLVGEEQMYGGQGVVDAGFTFDMKGEEISVSASTMVDGLRAWFKQYRGGEEFRF
ncbi:MAG: hypothetical protein U5N86_03995 [Planctomycetota bacterium]|nr:hypothetical protein [Planctomycetota bacterium]